MGRYHPSRTILCTVNEGRTGIDAQVSLGGEDEAGANAVALGHERVVVDIPPSDLKHLDTVVDPLVVTDLATVVWAPHRHHEGVDSLLKLTQVVLLDTVEEPSVEAGLRARPTSRRRPTWWISRGCGARLGASASRPPSILRSGARS